MGGRRREAEAALARRGISCFATPGREEAAEHGFYTWMLNGMALYECLRPAFPLFDGSAAVSAAVCFETFPQAVACALAGRVLPAKRKRADRRGLLEEAGIAAEALPSIDFIDAALCALAAHRFILGRYEALGDRAGGFLILPCFRTPGPAP